MKINSINQQSGFTLLELVITTFLVGVLLTVLVIFGQITFTSQFELFNSSQALEDTRFNLDQMAKELRSAKAADTGAFMLGETNDQELIFYSDIDGDGVTERVRYTLAGTDLQKGITKPSGVPLQYITTNESVATISSAVRNDSTPLFYYYNQDWPQDTTNNPLSQTNRLANAKLVKIYLTINPDTTHPEQQYTLEQYVQLRNLKTNL